MSKICPFISQKANLRNYECEKTSCALWVDINSNHGHYKGCAFHVLAKRLVYKN